LTTKDVVRADAEVKVSVVGVNVGVAIILSLLVAVSVTVPVNPAAGVTVKVIPEAVAPGCTVTVVVDPVHGVRAKSPLVEETISKAACEPLGYAVGLVAGPNNVPLEPAFAESPE
jgi:hypothetical protein